MATIQFKKGDDYLMKISQLEALTRDKVCGRAIYGAAEIVADEIRTQLKKVPTDEGFGSPGNPTAGPRKAQKKGLYDSLGIASMQEDEKGFLNVKIGFDGYNALKSQRWPNGQPNQMVARSIERGTTYMQPNKFVKKAMSKSRKRAKDFMKKSVDESIAEIMEKG